MRQRLGDADVNRVKAAIDVAYSRSRQVVRLLQEAEPHADVFVRSATSIILSVRVAVLVVLNVAFGICLH